MCVYFGLFFQDRISEIRVELHRRAELPADSQPISMHPCKGFNTMISHALLKPVQTSNIIKIIGRSPTWLIRQLPGTMAHTSIIADIVNKYIALSIPCFII